MSFGKHPRRRNTYNKPILGQTDKQTAPSALARSDSDSQRHKGQPSGHSMGTKPAANCGYARAAHHTEHFKGRGK